MKKSERAKWLDKCKKLIREQKFKLVGKRCQFCGKTEQLGLFHILGVGAYPRIQLHEDNILIACWRPCHYSWHHNFFYARDIIEPRITKLCGEGWEQRLHELYRTEPKLSLMRIKERFEELKELNR